MAILNDYVSSDLQLALGANHRSLSAVIQQVHHEIRARSGYAPLRRIAVALYHPRIDTAATLVESCIGHAALGHYEAPLSTSKSLQQLAASGRHRVIDEIAADASGRGAALQAHGYRSSMACPIYSDGGLFGFVFFDADQPRFFEEPRIPALAAYAKVIALLLLHELLGVRLMKAVTQTALAMARLRDDETGAHLERMASYARVIAREGAADWGVDDEFIEFLFLFAPLHDIGKVGVPDQILLKPGRLDPQELVQMRRHVSYGVEIVDSLVSEFGFSAIPHLDIARNIIAGHHENVDGSGYPNGLADTDIPLEGRIVAVADVFDALTSDRPYKGRWSNEDAFAYIRDLAGKKFDRDCVRLFLRQKDEIVAIQRRVRDSLAA